MKRYTTILLIALMATFTGFSQSVGSSAQGFTLDKLGGGSASLSDYEGKVVLVFLFGNSCPSCIGAASSIKSNLIDEFSNDPNFVAIGMDVWNGSSAQVQNFKNSTGLNIDLFLKASGVASSWGTTYDRLVVISPNGKFAYIGGGLASTTVSAAKSVLITELDNVSTALSGTKTQILKQNYPNPFSDFTNIPFSLTEAAKVKIEVLDLSGKLVEEVVDAPYNAGSHSVIFNRDNLHSGIYFYRIHTGSIVETHKMNIR